VLDVQSKQLIKSASSRGEGVGSILQNQIDDLSREISQSIGISETAIKGTQFRISDVTTASMEAYHNFLKGQEAFDNIYYEDARKFLERAIGIDSAFAVAYLYLARVNDQLNEDEARDANYEKAKIYAHKANDKDRMYIEAYYAKSIEKNPEKRLIIMQQMADKYPREKQVFFSLGKYYHGEKEYTKSIDSYEKALQLDPHFGAVLNDLAYVYGDMGEFEKADEYLKKYSEALPGNANPFDSFGELYVRTGQFDKAIEKYKEALEVKPDFGSEWRIACLYGTREDYKTAIEWIDQYITRAKSQGQVTEGYWWKGFYYYLSGNPSRAEQLLDSCIEFSHKIKSRRVEALTGLLNSWILLDQGKAELGYDHYIKWYEYNINNSPQYLANWKADLAFYHGMNYIKQSKTDSARIELDEIRKLFPELTPLGKERHQYNKDYLYTQILIAEDSLDAAEKSNQKIKPMETPFRFIFNYLAFNFPFTRDGLAQVYQQHGKIDQAINEYKKLIELDPKKREPRFINAKYHYRLAKLYEQNGQTEKAIQQYSKFLKIWEKAEQNLPEFIDARKKVEALNQ
jgi:tetratricopeptide (TPR) repeat protein